MAYRVEDHWLIGTDGDTVQRKESPNHGGEIVPEFLIVHFTAGRSAKSSVDWLTNPKSKVSAHLVIGRDGSVTQLVAFNQRAWHAGPSQWAGRSDLNSCSIGIELDNKGKLHRAGSHWQSWFGEVVPDSEVVEAAHKAEHVQSGWHTFSAEQLSTLTRVGAALAEQYTLRDVMGHEDIAPGRKNDPGPLFPMDVFRSAVLGRQHGELPTYVCTTTLNLRSEPSSSAAKLVPSGLPTGTAVRDLGERVGSWWRVLVLVPINGDSDLEGWVHSAYLNRQT